LLDLERIHQSDDVEGAGRLLGVAHSCAGEKARGAVAEQIGNDDVLACRCQQTSSVDKAVDVAGPAVQKNYRGTLGWAGFGVSDIQDASIHLLDWAERGVCARLDGGT
jgi:hypothetical protein